MLFALIVTMFGIPAHASTNGECARTELAKIYTAQKAYFAEKREYSEDFGDIGYDPNFEVESEGGRGPASVSCEDWIYSIDRVERPAKFTASAHSRRTGEEWSIDESNKINKK